MAATVRLALPDDVRSIMQLLRSMHAEESTEPVNEAKVHYTLTGLVGRVSGVVGVIRGAKMIEATIGLRLEEAWYSSAPYLNKLWLFVHADHRKSTHAKLMLEFAKLYSDQIGIPLVAEEMVAPHTEKRVDLVARQLMPTLPPYGRLFIYNRRQMPNLSGKATVAA